METSRECFSLTALKSTYHLTAAPLPAVFFVCIRGDPLMVLKPSSFLHQGSLRE